MANPVTTADLAASWRPLEPAEQARAAVLIDRAWAIVLRNVPEVESRLAASPATLDSTLAVQVVTEMVRRVMDNPDGWTEEALDDWRGKRADIGIAPGVLGITADEIALLSPTAGDGSSAGAWTIGPTGHDPVVVYPDCTVRGVVTNSDVYL